MGSFKAFVEIGRVCLISHGKEFGKLVVIADVVDQNRVRNRARTRGQDERRHRHRRERERMASRRRVARRPPSLDRAPPAAARSELCIRARRTPSWRGDQAPGSPAAVAGAIGREGGGGGAFFLPHALSPAAAAAVDARGRRPLPLPRGSRGCCCCDEAAPGLAASPTRAPGRSPSSGFLRRAPRLVAFLRPRLPHIHTTPHSLRPAAHTTRLAPPENPSPPNPKKTNKQALCDAPGMVRQVINFKQLAVTPMKIEIPRIAKKKVLLGAWKEAGESWCCRFRSSLVLLSSLSLSPPPARALTLPLSPAPPSHEKKTNTDVDGKFAASAWGKKLAARSAKAAMTDLDRYKAKAGKGGKKAAAGKKVAAAKK